MIQHSRVVAMTGLVLGATAAAPAGTPITVDRVAHQGQVVNYKGTDITLGAINAPFANGKGQVGFTGGATPGGSFVWFDNGITWLNTDDLTATVTGAEGTMGISNDGGFIYSPSVNGNDAVYTHEGVLLAADDPIPNSGGLFSTFNSRPIMLPDSTAIWVAGQSAVQGGSTAGRMLLRATDPTNPNTITSLLNSGDSIDGNIINASGVGFTYGASDNGAHVINQVNFTGSTAVDAAILLNNAIIAREGSLSPDGTNYATFSAVSVNNTGNWVLGTNTAAATTGDELLLYNGAIAVAEGQTIDGVTLTGAVIREACIDNNNRVMHMWAVGTPEVVFVGQATDLATSSQRIIGTGDEVDYTGDSVADATVTDFNASLTTSLSNSLSEADHLYLEVDLTDLAGGLAYEAIIRVPIPPQSDCPADIVPTGTVDIDDLLAVISAWGACPVPPAPCPADIVPTGTVDIDDLLAVISAWGPCP